MKCIFCFGETGKIYFDKKDRPYFYDPICGNRIFFRSSFALKAILAWAETAKALEQNEFIGMVKNIETSQIYKSEGIQRWAKNAENACDVVEPERSLANGNE